MQPYWCVHFPHVARCLCSCCSFRSSFFSLCIPVFTHFSNSSSSFKTQFQHWILGKAFPYTHFLAVKSDWDSVYLVTHVDSPLQTISKDHVYSFYTPNVWHGTISNWWLNRRHVVQALPGNHTSWRIAVVSTVLKSPRSPARPCDVNQDFACI